MEDTTLAPNPSLEDVQQVNVEQVARILGSGALTGNIEKLFRDVLDKSGMSAVLELIAQLNKHMEGSGYSLEDRACDPVIDCGVDTVPSSLNEVVLKREGSNSSVSFGLGDAAQCAPASIR